jgi:hypothetical protein
MIVLVRNILKQYHRARGSDALRVGHGNLRIGGAMIIKRNIGTIALLGGSTAALAMLTGLAGARADDLKVNQQLLSERLDQLAAVGLQQAPAPISAPTGVRRPAPRSAAAASRARS